jgi:type I restriction enzyme, S subunit
VTDTELELPQGWKWCKFQDVTDVVRGGSPRPKGDPRYFGGTIPWIMIRDISKEKGKFLTKTKDTVTEEGAKKSRLLKKGSLILSNSGTVCVPKILKVDGCIHDGFLTFPDIPKNMNIDYAYYWFEKIRTKIRQENQQGITQVNLNIQIVKIIDVPLPPLNEQKRIVSKIEELFSRIDSTKQSLEDTILQLDQYRKLLLKSAFEGKLTEEWRKNNPTENYVNTEFKNLPKTWKIVELQEISKIIDSLHVTPKYESEGIFMVRSTEIKFGNLNLKSALLVSKEIYEKFTRNYTPKRNDIVMSRVGTYFVTSFVNTDEIFCMGQNTLVIHPLINPKFLYYNLNSVFIEKQIQEKLVGSSGQRTISLKNIKELLLSLPPLEEQEQIISKIEQGFSLIENTSQMIHSTLQKLQTMKMSILKQAFEGKLVPQDPNDEPASVLLERIKAK